MAQELDWLQGGIAQFCATGIDGQGEEASWVQEGFKGLTASANAGEIDHEEVSEVWHAMRSIAVSKVAARLTDDDVVAIAAYTASLTP